MRRSRFQWKRILAASRTEIVLDESIAGPNPRTMQDLVRIDLAALPALPAAWAK